MQLQRSIKKNLDSSTKYLLDVVWKVALKLLPEIHAEEKVLQLHTRLFPFIIEANSAYFSFILTVSQTRDQWLQFIAFLGPRK